MDKTIQELKAELKGLSPDGGLSRAVKNLNDKLREFRLLASQIHFAWDNYLGTNLHLNKKKLGEAKE